MYSTGEYLSDPALFFAEDSAKQLANILPSAGDQERIALFKSYIENILKDGMYRVQFDHNREVFHLLLDSLPENKGNLVEQLFYHDNGYIRYKSTHILHILTEIGESEGLSKCIQFIPAEKRREIFCSYNELDKKNMFNLALYHNKPESMKVILEALPLEKRAFFIKRLYDSVSFSKNGINLAYYNGKSSEIFQVVLDSLENDETKIDLLLDEESTPLKSIIRDMDFNTRVAKTTQTPVIIKNLAKKLEKFHIIFNSIEKENPILLKEVLNEAKEPEVLLETAKHFSMETIVSTDMHNNLNKAKTDITELINRASQNKGREL